MPHVMQKFKEIERGQVVRVKAFDTDAVVVGFVPAPESHFAAGTPNASFGEAEPLVHVMWAKDAVMSQAQVPLEAIDIKDGPAKDDGRRPDSKRPGGIVSA